MNFQFQNFKMIVNEWWEMFRNKKCVFSVLVLIQVDLLDPHTFLAILFNLVINFFFLIIKGVLFRNFCYFAKMWFILTSQEKFAGSVWKKSSRPISLASSSTHHGKAGSLLPPLLNPLGYPLRYQSAALLFPLIIDNTNLFIRLHKYLFI